MGSGKTSAAIATMQNDTESRYIFLTPYLSEVERIKSSCPSRHFVSPENRGKGKLDSLQQLLAKGRNIASTHALFSTYTDETAALIRQGRYKLILDEVFSVVESVNISPQDLQILFDSGLIRMENDGEHVMWADDTYTGAFQEIKELANSHNLIYYKNSFLFWNFPYHIFDAFSDITILTYMFKSQLQKYYYDINQAEIEYIGVEKSEKGYRFSKNISTPEYCKGFKDKIHILQHERLNSIGDKKTALSVAWYEREDARPDKPSLNQLRKNLINLYKQIFVGKSTERMWTTYSTYQNRLAGGGYSTKFVSCNARATNEYRERRYLAYCINVFVNPFFKNYFAGHGAVVDEDGYALSEMIQWIWRSAVREGKDVWIYIPSSRMRNLLIDWLNSF